MEFLTHFGLVRAPFSLEANPQDYYQSGVQSRVLLNLQTKLANGDNDIRVQGEAGLGKSILAQQLVAQLSPDTYAPVLVRDIVAGFPMHIRALLQAAWGGDSSEIIGDLIAKGIQPVLVIDGTEKLTDDSASMVEQLQENGLSVVRFGRAEEDAELTLSTWDSKAIARMIVHRLKSAGSQRSLFARDALLKLVKKSEGNPGQAVLLCSEALYAAWLAGADTVQDELTDAIASSDFAIAMLQPSAPATPAETILEDKGEPAGNVGVEDEVASEEESLADIGADMEVSEADTAESLDDFELEAEAELEDNDEELVPEEESFDLESLTDESEGFEIEDVQDDAGFELEDLAEETEEEGLEGIDLTALTEDEEEPTDDGFDLEALGADEEDTGFELEALEDTADGVSEEEPADDLDSMLDDLSIGDVEAAAESGADLDLDVGTADADDDPLSDLDDLLLDDNEPEAEDDGLDELSEFESLAESVAEPVAQEQSSEDDDLLELDSELDSIMESATEDDSDSAEDDLDDMLADFGEETEIVEDSAAASGDGGDDDLESELDDLLKEFEDF